MKVGYISIVGKPNVGKSTLMNDIFKKNISIVTPKAQTTRDSILGVYNDADSQIVFLDTPGIHQSRDSLNTMMNKSTYNSIRSSDIALLILDASHKFDKNDQYLFDRLKFDMPLLVVFNKIDLTNVILIEKLKDEIRKIYPNLKEIIEISAKDGFNIDYLISRLKIYLPDGEKFYSEDYKNENQKFLISEIIRKNILFLLKDEIPHSVFVKVKDMEEKSKEIIIDAKIIVEKDSQKGIVIGKSGNMIKKIGIKSREELEVELKKHVVLNLLVGVEKNWKNNEKFLINNGVDKIK